ncbi:MAG: sensor histidine kinase [Candidatus Kapaibacteriota bacterium]
MKTLLNGKFTVVRSTLEPTKIYEFLLSSTVFRDVLLTLINSEGKYQLTNPRLGTVLEKSPFTPPQSPKVGVKTAMINNRNYPYGYCWLAQTDWCVIVCSESAQTFFVSTFQESSLALSAIIIIFLLFVIYLRAKKIVEYEREKEIAELEKNIARSQLEHASKLATIGELAAGIAHEINNPLAIIASEAGLIKDLINPVFGQKVSFEDLIPHLDIIQNSAFRARDITRKLMTFVRKDDLKLDYYDVNQIINELLEGFFERELYV